MEKHVIDFITNYFIIILFANLLFIIFVINALLSMIKTKHNTEKTNELLKEVNDHLRIIENYILNK